MIIKLNRKQNIILIISIIILIAYYFSLSKPLFNKPTSTVILSSDGRLLGARIADDGQWRFPTNDSVPDKFKQAIIAFEDQYFYSHPGVNLASLARAAIQFIQEGRIVSGGSTLNMQTVRLSQDYPKRNIYQKVKEIILATRLSLSYSKDEILSLYSSNAPFGGNVVGLDAAAWRFFGRQAKDLSWAESATLAVLPNAPSLIYPGKNEAKLRAKRNRLLLKLLQRQIIDSLTYSLSLTEDLPKKAKSLPSLSPHLLQKINKHSKGKLQTTTIEYDLQKKNLEILREYSKNLYANKIFNAAIMVIEVSSGNVLSYVGNTEKINDGQNHANYVDIIQSKRSSGSILKPLLYAYMLQEGLILPQTIIPDIPTVISNYKPRNFDRQYTGASHADEALQQSLNIPAVRELQMYDYHRFYQRLQELGFTTINRPADNYGLSLILGGAEVSLWELAKVYSSMARVLNNYHENGYDKSDWHQAYTINHEPTKFTKGKLLNAGAIWFTFEAMRGLNRPQSESGWRWFSTTKDLAWKTGTSHGYRDAWAVGVNKEYCIAVWVGNADGEGRSGNIGLETAAPLLFKVFDQLPKVAWFKQPLSEMIQAKICKESGYRAGPNCPTKHTTHIPVKGEETSLCPYHKLLHLDANGEFQVNSTCESPSKIMHKKFFILPPVMAWYYQRNHPEYIPPPPFRSDCMSASTNSMEMIYPKSGAKVFIPMEHSGKRGAVVFELAHKQSGIKVYWHLDSKYLNQTQGEHQISLSPSKGRHQLTLVDENGESISLWFQVVD
ncbi:MAG: penicillin-binding protein 1C [Bacteroidales bacterium]|nr:penicillin-binding protein 1C [Bacteroidales bacterium]